MTQQEQFLSHLPKDGSGIGNGSLMNLLEWDQATYDLVKTDLITKGAIATGRGRGGSVKLAGAAPAREVTTDEAEYTASAELVEEREEVQEEPEVTLDPMVAVVSGDSMANLVIEALQKKYRKTKFYTVKSGEDVIVRVKLIVHGGGTVKELSPDILQIARQYAANVLEQVSAPKEEPVPEEAPKELEAEA